MSKGASNNVRRRTAQIITALAFIVLSTISIANDPGLRSYGYGYQGLSPTPSPGELFINELETRPLKGEPEWIELFSTSQTDLDLTDCIIRDAIRKIFTFEPDSHIQPGSFSVAELSGSKLNNGGDKVELICSDQLIDSVLYGDYSTEPNLLPAPDGSNTLGRSPDGGLDWQLFSRDEQSSRGSSNPKSQTEDSLPPGRDYKAPAVDLPGTALVTTVIDGDTIYITYDGRKDSVRLIGVDTPEIVHPFRPLEYYGREASDYTRSQLEGRTIDLKYDAEARDSYDRLLAYVYIDGRHFNAELIQKGFAFAYLKYPFKYSNEFAAYEEQAREAGLGLWASDEAEEIQQEQEIFVEAEPSPGNSIDPAPTISTVGWDKIKISKVFPNPAGKDYLNLEYIEFTSQAETTIDLQGWEIRNSNNQLIFKFLQPTLIAESLKINPTKNIKNSNESLKLVDAEGRLHQEISCAHAIKDNCTWFQETGEICKQTCPQKISDASNIYLSDTTTKKVPTVVPKGPKISSFSEGAPKPLYLLDENPSDTSAANITNWSISSNSKESGKEPIMVFITLIFTAVAGFFGKRFLT